MSLPVGLSVVAVACGPYTDASGAPYRGVVTFTPSTSVVWDATGQALIDGRVVAVLDATGAAAVVLPATDAAGLTAAGWTYTVGYALLAADGGRSPVRDPYAIQLPSAAPTVVLELLASVPASDGSTVSVQAVQSVAGLTGVVAADDLKAALGATSLLDRGSWATGTGYAAGDVVTHDGQRWACRTAHTSTSFATDLGAARWVALDAVAAAPTSRQVTAGIGLTGGGDLTVDRSLAVIYGTTAGTAAAGDDTRLTNARTPAGTATGDLSGTYPSPTVAKVNGVAISGSPTAGQIPIASSSTVAAWGTVSVAGEVAGSAATYGTLPTANLQGQALRNGDVAYLTADTIGTGTSANPQWPRGAYTWNGAAWVLVIAIGADLQFGTVAGTIAQGNDARIVGALQAANNLSDVANAVAARTNLAAAPTSRQITAGTGLTGGGDLTADRTLAVSYGTTAGTAAQGNDSRIVGALQATSNLSDLANAGTARTNLGLGGAATLAVGTSAGTVAAGDDSRITGAAQKTSNLSDLTSASTARANLGVGASVQVDTYSTAGSYVWTMPTVAKVVYFQAWGSGGGGGSGRRGAAASSRCAGAGGGGGGYSEITYPAALLPSSLNVFVGAGVAGAAGQTSDSTDGIAGTVGNPSVVTSAATFFASVGSGGFRLYGGGGGGGGGPAAGGATGGAGGASVANNAGSTGAGSAGSGGTGGAPAASAQRAACGGGAGGGLTSADVASPGGAGGVHSASLETAPAGGTGGGNGAAGFGLPGMGATGGGGGGASLTANGGSGGAGGFPGGGGGGGTASVNGFTSGTGGSSGAGLVIITTYF